MKLTRHAAVFLCLCTAPAFAGPPEAPPAEHKTLAYAQVPAGVRKILGNQPEAKKLKLAEVDIIQADLDHDGTAEWLIAGTTEDDGGVRPVNRPIWVVKKAGAGWRKLGFLGFGLLVEAQAQRGTAGPDAVRFTTRDGPRHVCSLFTWKKDHYEQTGPCPPKPEKL